MRSSWLGTTASGPGRSAIPDVADGAVAEDAWARHRPRLVELRDRAASIAGANEYFRARYELLADPAKGPPLLRLFFYQLAEGGIDSSRRVVLDAGCGSGIYSVLFTLEGATRVEAIDFMPENVAALTRLVEAESLPIRAQCGDVATTSIPGDSVDVVFCNEAISHFHDWRAFLVEVARVLRPGGRLVIADWNNGANAWVRRSIRREWRESEVGPFLADRFSPGQRSAPYLFRRWMILRREFPELGDESVFQLGLRTSGSGGEELRGAAREYLRTGKLPDRIYRNGTSPRRPEDGQRHEEPVDPREIVRILRGVGVESFARPHFGFSRSALLPLVNRVAAGFGNLPLLFAPKYRVYGRKSQ